MEPLLANLTANSTNSSSSSILLSSEDSGNNQNALVGFVGCLICVLGFGSSYIPVKKYNTGDGFYYQMFLGLGIWIVGLCVNIVQGFPKVEGIVLIGGVIWSIGNFLAVYTIQLLGMALGIPLYNVFLLIVGWSTGTFGLGIKKNVVSMPVLNYIGLVVAIVAVILYIFVNSSGSDDSPESKKSADAIRSPDDLEGCSTPSPLRGNYDLSEDGIEIVELSHTPGRSASGSDEDKSDTSKTGKTGEKESKNENVTSKNENDEKVDKDKIYEDSLRSPISDFINGLSPKSKKISGVIVAILTGVCFSVNFIPAQHLIDYDDDSSNDQLDYIFIHFTGLLMTTLVAFLVYAGLMKNRPNVYPRLAIPAFINGVLIGLAQVGWYIGNKNLSFNITFPINTSGPSVVASLWGIIAFREIRGAKQLTLVSIAIFVSILGVIFITLSKFL